MLVKTAYPYQGSGRWALLLLCGHTVEQAGPRRRFAKCPACEPVTPSRARAMQGEARRQPFPAPPTKEGT